LRNISNQSFDAVHCFKPTLSPPQDAKFAAAFYFALRDTLVAANLEQATQIAYGVRQQRDFLPLLTIFQGSKKFRVVTLEGQLIDVSGTMSGGGAKV
jgi:structural maintenance of chromosome 4